MHHEGDGTEHTLIPFPSALPKTEFLVKIPSAVFFQWKTSGFASFSRGSLVKTVSTSSDSVIDDRELKVSAWINDPINSRFSDTESKELWAGVSREVEPIAGLSSTKDGAGDSGDDDGEGVLARFLVVNFLRFGGVTGGSGSILLRFRELGPGVGGIMVKPMAGFIIFSGLSLRETWAAV